MSSPASSIRLDSSPSPPAMPVSALSNPARTVATNPTGASSRRRNAKASARALGASTHWRSSTATTVGLESESMRSTPRVARATAVGSTLRDLARRRNACSSAAYWISGSRPSASSSTRGRRRSAPRTAALSRPRTAARSARCSRGRPPRRRQPPRPSSCRSRARRRAAARTSARPPARGSRSPPRSRAPARSARRARVSCHPRSPEPKYGGSPAVAPGGTP